MYHQRKTVLQLVLIVTCAFGCSVATLSGAVAMWFSAPHAAPVVS
ncbi:hypothetical protein [Sphingosinicella rhizophila]|uniref:Lipoprotein n=1 Tax=Sphingosinicella rhizophila TaxID=3050082 RepID=A0ABU3QCN7_9SPHN|nr:hypothetical protein [Sphingosinicella sp. GR2756]MDT9600715.1 hypothetical protein [Sphingosinicella sp. GR2756]